MKKETYLKLAKQLFAIAEKDHIKMNEIDECDDDVVCGYADLERNFDCWESDFKKVLKELEETDRAIELLEKRISIMKDQKEAVLNQWGFGYASPYHPKRTDKIQKTLQLTTPNL